MRLSLWSLLAALCLVNYVTCQGSNDNETEAQLFLEKYNVESGIHRNNRTLKFWNYHMNISNDNEKEMVVQEIITSKFKRAMRLQALNFNTSAMSEDIKRQFQMVLKIGVAAEPNNTKVEQRARILAAMQYLNYFAKGCIDWGTCTENFHNDSMINYWLNYYFQNDFGMRKLFIKYVQLSNEGVQYTGYKDLGEQWRSAYESETFLDDVQNLYDQILPLYQQLHAYIRRRLKQHYGNSLFPGSGHIPDHIIFRWNLKHLMVPFPDKSSNSIREEMIRQNYTVDTLLCAAEDFFLSLGFEEMIPTFWTDSVFTHPNDDRDMICHPCAFEFVEKNEFRIKMCSYVSYQEMYTIHHEMGHVQYFMQYKNQPTVYRNGANPGFHEALGDVFSLSVQTPEHMKKLCLIDEVPTDNETDINFLMDKSREFWISNKIGYVVDKWRWSVFSGNTTPQTYTKDWWDLRCKFEGVYPPLERTDRDFDMGDVFHITVDSPTIRYYISFILQFQFHKALCQAAGHTGPLHRCDIYNSARAGQKIREILELGSSRPWPEVLKQLTGTEKIDASALLEYFQPLMDFLRKENGNDYGWDPECPI